MNEGVNMLKSHTRNQSLLGHSINHQSNNYLPPLSQRSSANSPPHQSINQSINQPVSANTTQYVVNSLDMLRKSTISPNPRPARSSPDSAIHQSVNQSTTSEDKDSDDEYALHMQFRLKQRAKEQIRNELIRKRRYQSINQSTSQDADSDDEVSLSEFIVPPSPKLRTRTLRRPSNASIHPIHQSVNQSNSFEAPEESFATGFKHQHSQSLSQLYNHSVTSSNHSANDLSMLSAQRQHLGGVKNSLLDSQVDDASPIIRVAKRLTVSHSQSSPKFAVSARGSPDVTSPFSQLSLNESPTATCVSPIFDSPNIASITRADSPSYAHSPYLSTFSSPSSTLTPSPPVPVRHSSSPVRKSPPDSDAFPMLNAAVLEKRSYLTSQRPSSRSSTSYVHQN